MSESIGKEVWYTVTFNLRVGGDKTPEVVEEAVTAMVDDELSEHRHGGTRCGMTFTDAVLFNVQQSEGPA